MRAGLKAAFGVLCTVAGVVCAAIGGVLVILTIAFLVNYEPGSALPPAWLTAILAAVFSLGSCLLLRLRPPKQPDC